MQLIAAYSLIGKLKQLLCIPLCGKSCWHKSCSAGENAGLCAQLVLAVFGVRCFVVVVVPTEIITSMLKF